MVTSNKLPEKKVFKMSDENSNAVVPQRTLLGEVNAHLTCYLCRGYYIDATTIVECLHSFCRSCIVKHLQVKSYCPVCEMMINSAKPNIKADKALQDIVYKLVPGLFQREMERRQQFYASRPGQAASATPEQRGEDTERIIFSPEDVISFSLEYADVTDTDSISSKSSDSNEQQPPSVATRRYLQCPAVVNISHLKKFLSMKFDIDSTQFAIDILYKRVPLPDYYTLMDIAYIYNWKRNEPMRFFYQIIDYIAIRNRYVLFDINRKDSHFRDRKPSPASTEDTNASSPAPHFHEQGSEASSGTDSPMPQENNMNKSVSDGKNSGKQATNSNVDTDNGPKPTTSKNSDNEVEKSQFLNSFELTPKSNNTSMSPVKPQMGENEVVPAGETSKKDKSQPSPSKSYVTISPNSLLKRKQSTPPESPGTKMPKIDNVKANLNSVVNKISINLNNKTCEEITNLKEDTLSKDQMQTGTSKSMLKRHVGEQQSLLKRPLIGTHSILSPKRKTQDDGLLSHSQSSEQKSVSPIKIQLPKSDVQTNISKHGELKPVVKKIPELKLGVPATSAMMPTKSPIVNKVRMDLLANNCDPTMDRSKILSHVKTSLAAQNVGQGSGDPLKSLFNSCNINIPSSLSITLTDQKLEQKISNENVLPDQKKTGPGKNNITDPTNMNMHRIPCPPVHNFIEILKLPEVDKKPQNKIDTNSQSAPNTSKKSETTTQKPSAQNKPNETSSAKGPVPSLKPIGDTKLAKQAGFFPITSPYQQKYIQSLEQSEKSKLPKSKMQLPKLMPATSKILNPTNKESGSKTAQTNVAPAESKARSDNVLDLSTSHTVQSHLGPQQTKTLETMQSIANLAKKQNLPTKMAPANLQQNSPFCSISSRTLTTESLSLRMPNINQNKSDKPKLLNSTQVSASRQDPTKSTNVRQTGTSSSSSPSANYHLAQHQNLQSAAHTLSRHQTRSPSSSPKLVIAEEKQANNESNANQSNQISSTQVCNANKIDPQRPLPGPSGPSKVVSKPMKQLSTGIRQPITPSVKAGPSLNSPTDILMQQQMLPQAFLRHQMEWLKNEQARQIENMFKNMSPTLPQNQKDFNKDNKQ